MRIAIFSEVFWPMVSGVSHALDHLVSAMTARGHACRVYAPAYPLPEGASDRRDVHRSAARPLFLYPDVHWGFPRVQDLAADFRAFRPDVVHVATEFAMGLAGMRLARQEGVPVVASAHTDYERYAGRYGLDWLMPAGWGYLRWFYSGAAAVLCPSSSYRDHLVRRGVARTGIWTRGVDTRLFAPERRNETFRAQLGLASGEPLVLCVGRLAEEKNLRLLLAAWGQRVLRGLPGHLVLVGAGPMADAIRAAGIPRVDLLGVLTGEALATAYASADLFAFPSSTETFGNVLLEAMAAGLPCVAARAGGPLDFARHNENAWLVAPECADALAGGIDAVLSDAHLRARLGHAARRTACARDWDTVFDDVEARYGSLIAGRALPRAA